MGRSRCAGCSCAIPGWMRPNYVDHEDCELRLCDDCVDSMEGSFCDICDRLCDGTYDEESWSEVSTSPWEWEDWYQVCLPCAWPGTVDDWRVRFDLSEMDAQMAVNWVADWPGTELELAEFVRR